MVLFPLKENEENDVVVTTFRVAVTCEAKVDLTSLSIEVLGQHFHGYGGHYQLH